MHAPLVFVCALATALCLAPSAHSQSAAPRAAPEETSTADASRHASAARQALDELVSLYERGDLAGLRARLDPGFIGYQRFLDGVQRDLAAQRLTRLHLLEPRITAGSDVAAIQVSWEKRFVDSVRFEPQLRTGTMIVLLHRTSAGWQLAAIQGDNPFNTGAGQPLSSSDRRRAAGTVSQ